MKKEILREGDRIRQMRKDFLNAKQKLVTVEGDLRVSLDLKKKEKEQLQKELANRICKAPGLGKGERTAGEFD